MVEPRIPLIEIDELIADSIRPVLVEHLVNGLSKSFGIGVGTVLIIVEENPGVRIVVV